MKNKEKISKLLIVVGVLLVIGIGITFAYYMVGVVITGDGAANRGDAAELINVKYDAGTSKLIATGLMPGKSVSKTFDVTVTPVKDTNEVTYAVKLKISENTFEYCDDANYNTLTNECIKTAEELIYTLKDGNGSIIATGNLTAITNDLVLAKETKTVTTATTYNYVLEIEFVKTAADQNHNINKTITGEVKVEFAE